MRVAPSCRSLIENQAAQRTRSAARQGGQTRLPSKRQASPLRFASGGSGRFAPETPDRQGAGAGYGFEFLLCKNYKTGGINNGI